jgi:ribosomal protein S18 acetylase RimI-like enzyme
VTEAAGGRRASWPSRRARPEDAGALARFGERTFRHTFAPDNSAADMDAYCADAFGEALQRAEIDDPSLATLLVETEGRIVGYAQFGPGTEPDCVVERPAWELRRLYVEPDLKGAGLARLLMDEVIAGAARGGAAALWLGVWERNPRAIRFYEKNGFSVAGDHVFQLGSDPQRDLIMVRRLG